MFLAVTITIFKRNHFNRQGLVSGTEAKSCFLISYTEELSYLLPFPASKFTIILRSCLNAFDVFFKKLMVFETGLHLIMVPDLILTDYSLT
jgi:hypothetical protein